MIFKDFQPWQIELMVNIVVAQCISRCNGEEFRIDIHSRRKSYDSRPKATGTQYVSDVHKR